MICRAAASALHELHLAGVGVFGKIRVGAAHPVLHLVNAFRRAVMPAANGKRVILDQAAESIEIRNAVPRKIAQNNTGTIGLIRPVVTDRLKPVVPEFRQSVLIRLSEPAHHAVCQKLREGRCLLRGHFTLAFVAVIGNIRQKRQRRFIRFVFFGLLPPAVVAGAGRWIVLTGRRRRGVRLFRLFLFAGGHADQHDRSKHQSYRAFHIPNSSLGILRQRPREQAGACPVSAVLLPLV